MTYTLLNVGRNAKSAKSDKVSDEWLTGFVYLAPGIKSGYETCPSRSQGCEKACLYTAGMGDAQHVRAARIAKTKMFFEQRGEFFDVLCDDLVTFMKFCDKHHRRPAVRLNATSDIMWETVIPPGGTKTIIEAFPEIQFYDYTKIPGRWELPDNYHLTFSKAEDNEHHAVEALCRGRNISMVFPSKNYPATYRGRKIIDGDAHDLRFLDPSPVVVGLKAKGAAKQDTSGFVVQSAKGKTA